VGKSHAEENSDGLTNIKTETVGKELERVGEKALLLFNEECIASGSWDWAASLCWLTLRIVF
jgi:hypothetical protein